MKTTLFTKNGSVSFDASDPEASLYKDNSPMWKAVSACFNNWLTEYASEESYSMYMEGCEEFNGGTYLNWRGAVEMGIDAVCEFAMENNLSRMTTKDFFKIDLEGVFQA